MWPVTDTEMDCLLQVGAGQVFPRKQEGVPWMGGNLLGRTELRGLGGAGEASRAPAPLAPGDGRGCQRTGAGVSPVGHPKHRDWAAARLTWVC